jgi:hypothetical protein
MFAQNNKISYQDILLSLHSSNSFTKERQILENMKSPYLCNLVINLIRGNPVNLVKANEDFKDFITQVKACIYKELHRLISPILREEAGKTMSKLAIKYLT